MLFYYSKVSFMLALCLRAVFISSPDTWDWTGMHALVVMHKRTLCENVDSAKILIFYAWHRYIDPHWWIVTPLTVTYLVLHEQIDRLSGQLPVQAVLDGKIHRLGLHFGLLGLWNVILLLLFVVFCGLKVITVTVNFPLQTLGVVEHAPISLLLMSNWVQSKYVLH